LGLYFRWPARRQNPGRRQFVRERIGKCSENLLQDAAFGTTSAARYLTIVFESKGKVIIRPITGWDMKRAEIQYYRKNKR